MSPTSSGVTNTFCWDWSYSSSKLSSMEEMAWSQWCDVTPTSRLVFQWSRVYQCFCTDKCSHQLFICHICITKNSINWSLCCFEQDLKHSIEIRCCWWVEIPLYSTWYRTLCKSSADLAFFTSSWSSLFAPIKIRPLSGHGLGVTATIRKPIEGIYERVSIKTICHFQIYSSYWHTSEQT